jgi:chromosome segregation ATPase
MRITIVSIFLAASFLPACMVSKSKYNATVAELTQSVEQAQTNQALTHQLSLQVSQLTSERDSLQNEIQLKNETGAESQAELVLCKDQLSKLQSQLSKKNEELARKEQDYQKLYNKNIPSTKGSYPQNRSLGD